LQDPTSALSDMAFLLFRLLVGTFLIWGVWDNIISAERMSEFSGFLRANGFSYPDIMAPISVYAQFICGAGILFGMFTRWVGILCTINFIVALIMVDAQGGFRQAFPAAMLVMFGLYISARGAGRFSFDNYASGLRKRG
ncbi:MAG: DoxX family protein, partial [Pseudomonadota bacterium]